MRNSQDWYKKSKYNLSVSCLMMRDCLYLRCLPVFQYDVHLCGYTALLKIVARFHEEIFSDPSSPSGLNKVGFLRLTACMMIDLLYSVSISGVSLWNTMLN